MEKNRQIILVRHGETAWTLSGQHTGKTDIPLTVHGEDEALRLKDSLAQFHVDHVLTSPLQRAKETCRLAGYMQRAKVDPLLVEWNYGNFEGLSSEQIQAKHRGWSIFKDGAPGGESIEDIETRAAHVLEKIEAFKGNILIFSHAHFLRALTACYLGLGASGGRFFLLKPASISLLGHEHGNPVIISWDNCS